MNYLRVVRPNKRNWIGTLKPNGTKSGYSGLTDIIEDGLSISGLWMAPKASTIIHDMETGKPHMFPFLGRNLVKGINNIGGKGYGKKRMSVCNRLNRGSYLDLKGCKLSIGVPLYAATRSRIINSHELIGSGTQG